MTLYLNSPKKDYSPIMVSCSYKSKQIQFSTGLSVCVKDWDKKKKRLKNSQDSLFSIDVNAQISEWITQTERCLAISRMKKLTYLETKNKIISIFKGEEKDKTDLTLLEFFEDARSNWGKPMHRNFKGFQNKFKDFSVQSKKTKATYNDVNIKLLDDFRKYLYELNLVESTVHTHFKCLFRFMAFGLEKGYHSNERYKPKSFKFNINRLRKAKANKFIYLRPDEYAKIKDLDFGQAYGVMQSADRLILECETGLRYSDMNDLSESNVREIKGKLHIQTATMKTAGNYSEPMSDEVLRIYRKYNNGFPPEITNQVFNRNLKEIGKLLGMFEIEHYIELRGGEKKKVEKFRWEQMCSHVGRRTYASLLYSGGEDLKIISLKMGHTSTSMTETYIHSDAYGERMRRGKG